MTSRTRSGSPIVRLALSLLATLAGAQVEAQKPPAIPNLAGHWALEKAQVSGPQSTSRPGVPVDAITIVQTSSELRVEGERGLYEGTAPEETYRLDGSKFIYVQKFARSWRKSQTWVEWDGATMILRLRTHAGWFRSSQPEQETLEHPQADVVRRVTQNGERLTIQTAVAIADAPPGKEKPTSTQVFLRTPRP